MAGGWFSGLLKSLRARFYYSQDESWIIGGPGRRREDCLPPKRSCLEWCVLVLADAAATISSACFIVIVGEKLYNVDLFTQYIRNLFYVAPAVTFLAVAVDRILRHRQKVHEARLEDRNEVERLLCEMRDQEPDNPTVKQLLKVGPEGWTEYQVLPLRQLLVNKADDYRFPAMVQTYLSTLEDYAEDAAYKYDKDLYYEWKQRIEAAIRYFVEADGDQEQTRTVRL